MSVGGILAKVGIVLAVVLSILAARVAPKWDGKETFLYNIVVYIAIPLIFPNPLKVMDKPVDVQAEYWTKSTQRMAAQLQTEGSVKSFGEAYYQAVYGPKPTRVANFTIASVGSMDDYSIPVSCACPHNATNESRLPIIFYFFGGGLIMGNIESEFVLARWLAQESEAVVCVIQYRLAPKYPYPAGMNDAIDASVAILEHKVSLDSLLHTAIDPDRVATWGTSAGGYMAAQTARHLTERGYSLKCQVAIVPMAKPHGGTGSMLKLWNAVAWFVPLSKNSHKIIFIHL